MRRLQQTAADGRSVRTIGDRPFFPYTTIGRTGLDHLQECLDTIRAEGVPGDLAECGAGGAARAIFMRGFLDAFEIETGRCGSPTRSAASPRTMRRGPERERTRFTEPRRPTSTTCATASTASACSTSGCASCRARYADTLADAPIGELALLHLGDDVPSGRAEALEALYDRLAPGGFVVVEHHDAPGCRRAVDEFRARARRSTSRSSRSGLDRCLVAQAAGRRRSSPRASPQPARSADRAPLARTVAEPARDLSVVVVFYNMRREAARTLHSLSRAYQREIEDLDYEVIVVENGSAEDQRLGEDFVRGFGPEFRYLDLGSRRDAVARAMRSTAGSRSRAASRSP